MKLALPSALLTLCLLTVPAVQAAYLHKDISLITYTDFGQNCGRYVSGTTNELLAAIRQAEGGILIRYTDDLSGAAFVLPSSLGMMDFSSSSDRGNVTAVGGNYFVSASHVYENSSLRDAYNPTFSGDALGSDKAIHYACVQRETPMTGNGETTDYCLARMSKVVTDARPYSLYTGGAVMNAGGASLFFRSGSGCAAAVDADGNISTLNWPYSMEATYAVGGINGLDSIQNFVSDYVGYPDSITFLDSMTDWKTSGIHAADPLPLTAATLDSGSGQWVYNVTNGRYEFIGTMTAAAPNVTFDTSEGTQTLGLTVTLSAGQWTTESMSAHDVGVSMRDGGILCIGAVNESAVGTISDGVQITEFTGVYGRDTWKKLNTEMNKEAWYAYGNSYLNGFGGDLSYLSDTSNLVLTAEGGTATVQLDATVDLGAGYAQFGKNGTETAEVIVKSAAGMQALFHHAGYIIDKGVNVHVQLTNSEDFAREWRKIGEGNLYIEGSGNNYIGLNLGGCGSTYLNQTDGYAAYNVLVNTGATVVLKDVNQIARDFTFGNGGGVLDFNGNSMVWNNSAAVADDGFTVHALTEEAVIANNGNGMSTLTLKDAGTTFLGSFRDSATGALQVVYKGSGTLNWHGIVTDLSHQASSGIIVESGTLVLSGTNTVHGQGSATGAGISRYTNADDWHYADAAADVTVRQDGRFELGSHARLNGNVRVESGGTFVMHEGVLHGQEYIEGGEYLQNTADVAAFYGLKGNVEIAQDAVMQVDISGDASVATEYAYSVSGAGSLIKTGKGALRLTGANTYSGGTIVQAGTLIAEQSSMLGCGAVTVSDGMLEVAAAENLKVSRVGASGTLAVGQTTLTSVDGTASVDLNGFLWFAEGNRTEIRAEAETELTHALLDLAEGTVLQLTNVVLASDTRITDAPATVELNNVRVLAEWGENAHITPPSFLKEDRELIGGSSETLTLESLTPLAELRLDTFSNVEIGGTTWSITLSGWEDAVSSSTDWLAITLGKEGEEATLASAVAVTLSFAGIQGCAEGYRSKEDSSTLYFKVGNLVPEPTSVTLALLALAGLCVRRRR